VCDIVVKKFTFAISSPDEFLFTLMTHNAYTLLVSFKLCNKSTTNHTNEFDTEITMSSLVYNMPIETSTHNLKIRCKKHNI